MFNNNINLSVKLIFNIMFKSLLIGFIVPLTIIFSGWLRLLFSFISISFGSRIPFLYFFLGISFGIGSIFKGETPFWPGFILGMIFSIGIVLWSSKSDKRTGVYSTVSTCASGFIIGGVIGMIIGLF